MTKMCNYSEGLELFLINLKYLYKLTKTLSQCESGMLKHTKHTQSRDMSACDQWLRIMSKYNLQTRLVLKMDI